MHTTSEPDVRPAAEQDRPTDPAPGRGQDEARLPGRRWAAVLVATVAVVALQLALVHRWAPRFFWFDDSQAQFGPVAWWLGRTAEGGRPPLMDPDLGMGGNFVADMQYGVLDPLHWLVQRLIAGSSDFISISWTYGALMLLLLAIGSACLLLQHRVHPGLAVAGAVGIASSGFLTWYGSSWWPLLWSTACLPWLWLGLRSRTPWGVLTTGLATWALLTSGNPYAFPFAGLVVVGQLLEYRHEFGSWRALLTTRVVARAAACVGGLVVAMPTFVSTLQMTPVMGRLTADPLVGNSGFGVPNLADVLVGGPTLLGQTNAWTGVIGLVPAMTTMLVALPLTALVDWRRAWRAPGVLTAGVVWGAAVVATQLPSTLSVFRYPVRYLVYVEVFLPLLVLVALAAAPVVNRRRVSVAVGLVATQAVLAWFRSPVFVKWHVLALVLGVVAVAAAVLVLRGGDHPRRRAAGGTSTPTRRRVLAGAAVLGVLLPVAAAFPLGEQMMVSLQDRDDVIKDQDTPDGLPLRALDPGLSVGTTEEQFRDNSYAPDQKLTVITWGFDGDRGWSDGVVNGSGNLIAGLEPGYASLAVWQVALNEHWCRTVWGATCASSSDLLAEAGDTGLSWVDLMSSDTVLLSADAPGEVKAHFAATWTRVRGDDTWVEYRRDDGLPGRITADRDVDVDTDQWSSGLARAGSPMDTYVVSTGSSPGTLATRIPYYPGITATLDGRSLSVDTVEGAAVEVTIPAGVDRGQLELSYAPAGASAVVPAAGVGGGIIVLAAVGAWVLGRRRPEGEG